MFNYSRPFWEMPTFPEKSKYFGQGEKENNTKMMVITGPSRNGNHLVHSLLDSHPSLPRIPGEDSALNYLFDGLNNDLDKWARVLRTDKCMELLLQMSGRGADNKWLSHYQGYTISKKKDIDVYSGVFFAKNKSNFIFDYQDTVFPIDYPSFESFLHASISADGPPKTLYDLVLLYSKALARLDPEYHRRRKKYKYDALIFGSGSRAPLHWLMSKSKHVHAVVPVRSFETYYFSFAKGFYGVKEFDMKIVCEAWEHWYHKAVDYYIIKNKYPEQVCIVVFDKLVEKPFFGVKKICEFFGLESAEECTHTTTFGHKVKGNSSLGKNEKDRGSVYLSNYKQAFDQKRLPGEYFDLWQKINDKAVN